MMDRSKSAGSSAPSKVTNEELRSACKLIAPYIAHEWRGVCEELGVADDVLDEIEADHEKVPMSELAFRALCKWQDMMGRAASKETLHRTIKLFGLRRADDQLRSLSQKRNVPYMGRPVTAAVTQDIPANKQAKQKALADRLSRPKSTRTSDQESGKQKKKVAPQLQPGVNPLAVQVTPSKPTDICEVKLKVTVKGVQRIDKDVIEKTHDDFKSTKDDFKNLCFCFVKLVMANRRAHFHELKELLGFNGISVQRLSQIGFNINVFLLCSSLGAFEILYQNYTTGRLKKIVHNALVTRDHLLKLKARQLELSVEIEEGMVNKYRDILIVRGPAEEDVLHPVDVLDYFQCDDDEECSLNKDLNIDEIRNFRLKTWHQLLHSQIEKADRRYQQFDDSMKDLLLILRIARREDKQEMTCLQDVINCYHHLKYSKSVAAQGSRSDIVYEYIAIVNFIRITVQEISDKSLLVSFDETLHPDACEAFHRLLAQIEEMLQPEYIFESDDSVTNSHVMTGLEKEMFGKFLCYLPKLLRLLYNLCDTLTATENAESVKEGESDENNSESTDHNDSGIALSREENNNTSKVHDKYSEVPTIENLPEQSSAEKCEQLSNASVVNYVGIWTQA
ncbi:uncharacterized protein LOC123562233 [Mercenaria mercenaria]|uniref:uncharacterized protein LOC123562233 n=1 Tax=Mercenaria mercenaria TaxID=6596 RepID=UPI00234E44FB|nr:uncharacterized protein LOC123562233 [Mercenaria mercenaria]